jgi:hypothetical protein
VFNLILFFLYYEVPLISPFHTFPYYCNKTCLTMLENVVL